MRSPYPARFFAALQRAGAAAVASGLLDEMVRELVRLREDEGRLFLLGVGGGAANCSHAAGDFRKLCGIEAYAATDNVAELTARANDEGWSTVFRAWLLESNLRASDMVMVFSVGGGNTERGISLNIHEAIEVSRIHQCRVLAVVGRDDGTAAKKGSLVLVVGVRPGKMVTPITETMQIAILHCLVSDPRLQINSTKW